MRIAVVSDLHYAGDLERARKGWERRAIGKPLLRRIAALYRRHLWLADPTAHNHQLAAFVRAAGSPDWVVGNGDYSCDSGFVGVADDAALASARECLAALRSAFGDRLLLVPGDHEFGKMSLFGGAGGLRFASFERTVGDLGIRPFWKRDLGVVVLMGVTSTLLALPAFDPEMLPEEKRSWEAARREHVADLAAAFEDLHPAQRCLVFCHDPTALPYLAEIPAVASRINQIEFTVIGHLHSELVLRTSRWLAGMPELGCLGNTARRLSGALRKARRWKRFRVVLCPATAGIQCLKDGGYLDLTLQRGPVTVTRHRLPWT